MSLPRSLFQRLPNLKLVTIIGMSLPDLDMNAATEHGVIVSHSDFANPIYAGVFNAIPTYLGIDVAVVRHFDFASRQMRSGNGKAQWEPSWPGARSRSSASVASASAWRHTRAPST